MDTPFKIDSELCHFEKHQVFRTRSTNMLVNISHGRNVWKILSAFIYYFFIGHLKFYNNVVITNKNIYIPFIQTILFETNKIIDNKIWYTDLDFSFWFWNPYRKRFSKQWCRIWFAWMYVFELWRKMNMWRRHQNEKNTWLLWRFMIVCCFVWTWQNVQIAWQIIEIVGHLVKHLSFPAYSLIVRTCE